MWRRTSAQRFRTSSRRPLAGIALLVLWLAFLGAYATGSEYCFDPGTGQSGIDALNHCASHHPLGLPLVVSDNWPLLSFALVPALLAVIWWPYRPWRARG